MIARNPKNHEDQWLVAEKYFKDNFEEIELSTEQVTELTFGSALDALKSGKRVARKGWNGKGMWPGYSNGRRTNIANEVIGMAAKMDFSKVHAVKDHVLPFIVILTATHQLVPWVASQTDMLSDDWEIVG